MVTVNDAENGDQETLDDDEFSSIPLLPSALTRPSSAADAVYARLWRCTSTGAQLALKVALVCAALYGVSVWREGHLVSMLPTGYDDVELVPPLPSLTFPTDARCPIYTFFQPVAELSSEQQQAKLHLWRGWFWSRGWLPTVLNVSHARALPGAADLEAHFSSLPTVNPPQYELYCYMRWMALAQVGGGVLLDYDIVDLTPLSAETATQPELHGRCEYGRLTTFHNLRPMLTYGNASEVMRLVTALAAYEVQADDAYDGRPHISDMLIVNRLIGQGVFELRDPVPWFHFSNHHMSVLNVEEAGEERIAFQSRALQLRWLMEHRVAAASIKATHGATALLTGALTLCETEGYSMNAEADEFCDSVSLSSGSVERNAVRQQLCSLIAAPHTQPFSLSQVACRYEQGGASLLLPRPTPPGRAAKTQPDGDVLPFIVAVVPNPVHAILRELEAARTEALTEASVSRHLLLTAANPIYTELTAHLHVELSDEQRWQQLWSLLHDPQRGLFIAEEDIHSSLQLRRDIQYSVGFDAHSLTEPVLTALLASCPTHARSMPKDVPDSVRRLIEQKDAADIRLHALIREVWRRRAEAWRALD